MQRIGQARDAAKGFVVFEAVAQRAKAAHGQPADKCILALVAQGKHAAGDLHQLLADKPPVIVVRVLLRHVKAIAGGHDDAQVFGLGPALDARAVDPVAAAAQQPVEQIEGFEGPVIRRFHAVHRKNHIHGNGAFERGGGKGNMQKSHGIILLELVCTSGLALL